MTQDINEDLKAMETLGFSIKYDLKVSGVGYWMSSGAHARIGNGVLKMVFTKQLGSPTELQFVL